MSQFFTSGGESEQPLHVSGQSIGWIYGKDNQKWIFFNRGLKQHAYESIDEGNEF